MKRILLVMAALWMAGCAVGPKYQRPIVQAPAAYKEAPPEAYKESKGWKTAQPADTLLRGDWWSLFGDADLNRLEDQVNLSNENLKSAEARFQQARALVRVNQSQKYPTVTGGAQATSNRDSSTYALSTSKTASNFGNFALP